MSKIIVYTNPADIVSEKTGVVITPAGRLRICNPADDARRNAASSHRVAEFKVPCPAEAVGVSHPLQFPAGFFDSESYETIGPACTVLDEKKASLSAGQYESGRWTLGEADVVGLTVTPLLEGSFFVTFILPVEISEETEDEFLARIAAKDVPDGVPFRIMDASVVDEVSTGRAFRNAWEDVTPEKVIDINMGGAQTIHMDAIRRARKPKLAALDLQYMRAQETGDTATMTAVVAEKQTLRDLPATFDLSGASTPDQLAALWPTALAE